MIDDLPWHAVSVNDADLQQLRGDECVNRLMIKWSDYTVSDDFFVRFQCNGLVLDVGCGTGNQLRQLRASGHRVLGIDLDRLALTACWEQGFFVALAQAEYLPFRAHVFHGLVCKVVIPLTDEARVLQEIGRVLIPGGEARFCYHGAGYYLRYLLSSASSWKFRIYAIRSLVNSWIYAAAGKRLPGFLGDTLYQSRRRLEEYYRASQLRLLEERPSRTYLGFPVFIYHMVEKVRP